MSGRAINHSVGNRGGRGRGGSGSSGGFAVALGGAAVTVCQGDVSRTTSLWRAPPSSPPPTPPSPPHHATVSTTLLPPLSPSPLLAAVFRRPRFRGPCFYHPSPPMVCIRLTVSRTPARVSHGTYHAGRWDILNSETCVFVTADRWLRFIAFHGHNINCVFHIWNKIWL